MRYVVVIEKCKTGFGAYVPDLPGCVATARTRAAALRLIREAVELHLAGLREDGLRIPKPSAQSHYVAPRGMHRKAG